MFLLAVCNKYVTNSSECVSNSVLISTSILIKEQKKNAFFDNNVTSSYNMCMH